MGNFFMFIALNHIIMKKILTIILAFSITTVVGQVKRQEDSQKSNFETFSIAAGSFSKKEIYLIGKVGSISIEAIKLISISNEKSLTALRLSATPYNSTYEKSAVLDADEVDGYLKCLKYIQTNVTSSPLPEISVEYNYYARGGVSSGIFNQTKKSKWTVYLDLEKYDNNSTFYLTPDDLTVLIDLVTQAKGKL